MSRGAGTCHKGKGKYCHIFNLQRYESFLNRAKRKCIFFFEVPKRGRSQDYLKQQNIIRTRGIFIWRSAMECAEIAAGADLVGADLGAGAGGAVEAGGLEPDVDMHVSVECAQLIGELKGTLDAIGT